MHGYKWPINCTRTRSHGVDGGDARGWTAYHLACASGHTEAVLALVTAGGCRTELRTAKTAAEGGDVAEKGLSGWAVARRNGCEGVDQLLTKLAKGQGRSVTVCFHIIRNLETMHD